MREGEAGVAVRGLCLLSGGLDSILAVKVLQEQEIKLAGVSFVTPFFGANHARDAAKQLQIELLVLDITEEHLKLVMNPSHGYGKNMNPCLDCHVLMIRKAGELLEKEGFDFLCTGEVLNERPFSQNRRALNEVADLSGYGDLLLRPLSAKLLPETLPERKGLVERRRLLDLSGRSRKRQFALAEKYGVRSFPSPAGGCLLTDPAFSRRLKDALDAGESGVRDMKLLRWGRHFRSPTGQKVILGRNELENTALRGLFETGDLFVWDDEFPGPVALVPGGGTAKDLEFACGLCIAYGDAPEGRPARVVVEKDEGKSPVTVSPIPKEDVKKYHIK